MRQRGGSQVVSRPASGATEVGRRVGCAGKARGTGRLDGGDILKALFRHVNKFCFQCLN